MEHVVGQSRKEQDMTHGSKWGWRGVLVAVGAVMALGASTGVFAAAPELKGKFEVLKDEKSTHQPGKVKLIEFADFYCPHCHRFDSEGVTLLKKEFGDKIEVTMVGFPVFQGKLPTPFDMYEQARTMGKGDEMKKILFRTIHTEKMTGVLDRSLREVLIKEVGLDPKAFEEGMASGKPAKALEESKKWGERIKVMQTPTILIDGNIKVEQIDPDNLKVVIHSILDADKKK